ncbi:hypothetical protein PO909_004368 [Leuciscus waleckii]
MEKELPQHKRRVLMLAVPNITYNINEKKKKSLEENIARVAFLSAFEIEKYCNVFGLDKQSLEKLCERSGKSIETIESLIKSVWHKGICTGSILSILTEASLLVTEDAVESVVVPLLGSITAGAMSYWAVSTMLKRALNDIAEDARNVLMALLITEV